MAENSNIEWTDATWNPITGCTMVSAGCTNCYAMGLAATRLRNHLSRAGLTRESGGRPVWTGDVRLNEQWLDQPLRWGRPRLIFVCAHGDLFHERVPDEWIDRVFAVMALAPQHTFQVLTKRPERARAYLGHGGTCIPVGIRQAAEKMGQGDPGPLPIALPNVWLGTSIEDQATANARIPHLLATPAAVRFLSCEPLLGPVDLGASKGIPVYWEGAEADGPLQLTTWGKPIGSVARRGWVKHSGNMQPWLDWVICGGESGPGARPMHPDWARSLRDQCVAAGVPFFFKQWGEWQPCCQMADTDGDDLYHPAPADHPDASRRCRVASACLHIDGQAIPIGEANGFHTMPAGAFAGPEPMTMFRVGKKAAGRDLDGRTWDQMPGGADA